MFAVINKDKKFFSGFSGCGDVIWSKDASKAKAMTLQAAKTQAALFISSGEHAHRKPVEL